MAQAEIKSWTTVGLWEEKARKTWGARLKFHLSLKFWGYHQEFSPFLEIPKLVLKSFPLAHIPGKSFLHGKELGWE